MNDPIVKAQEIGKRIMIRLPDDDGFMRIGPFNHRSAAIYMNWLIDNGYEGRWTVYNGAWYVSYRPQ